MGLLFFNPESIDRKREKMTICTEELSARLEIAEQFLRCCRFYTAGVR